MRTPRSLVGDFLNLADDEHDSSPAPQVEDDDFLEADERRRGYAVAEAEEVGLWCFVTRQDDLAWLRLTRLQRNAMSDAINRAHRRR